jgi:hypothetical protein
MTWTTAEQSSPAVSESTVPSPTRRWHTLGREANVSLAGITIMVAGAIGVRVWFMLSAPAALVGFPDSSQYALAAALNIFRDAQRPAGYPFFLRLVHHLSNDISLTIAVQHTLGLATGLLLYKAVRRTGAPAWLGLLPAAVVFFGGTGLFLEHSLLADSLFAFLQAVGVYAGIRVLYDPGWRWALVAGVAIGVSFWVKTAAISSAILLSIVFLCASPGDRRRRIMRTAASMSAVVMLIVAYVGTQYYFTGYLGYERQSAWDLYGRVATFVDCSDFTPPVGTASLCPTEPVDDRAAQAYYQDASTAPAVERFGPPYAAPPSANHVLQEFSIAAIEHEPMAYAQAILRGLGRYVFPRPGEGYTPGAVREAVTNPPFTRAVQSEIALLYPGGSKPTAGEIGALADYERHTRIEGPLLILMLLLAIAGPLLLLRRLRWAAIIFTYTALFSITFAVAGNGYDARYAYPTFGPLSAGAALGTWALAARLAHVIRAARPPASASDVPSGDPNPLQPGST